MLQITSGGRKPQGSNVTHQERMAVETTIDQEDSLPSKRQEQDCVRVGLL